ncbi:MAG TPA: histidine--tRNA ligase [Gammaproteobacteria bacterium]|nr:histidine--tRNA ligase [Gammaproteobacteria bacterium]
MSGALRAVRGFNDILPAQVAAWRAIENTAAEVLETAGYAEIRLPLVEHTALFARSIGSETDIVAKEMYSFEDRGGEMLSLRPEATAGCARAGIAHGLFNGGQQRLWYGGAMFRHERPQKGRHRQFHQIGAEAFGIEGAGIEAELLALAARLWRRLGLRDYRLEINSLGSPEDRARFRGALVEYFSDHAEDLDADERRRLATNPLRILDSKSETTRALLAEAPDIGDYLGVEALAQREELAARLALLEIPYRINSRLVRGLDYYTGLVFEWTSEALGAQNAFCSGGRYDHLVAELGGRPTPAAGWALGLERLVLLVEEAGRAAAPSLPDAYFIALGREAEHRALGLSERLRDALPSLRLVVDAGGGSLRAQLRRADKAGAALALIVGEAELSSGTIAVKPLAGDDQQTLVAESRLAEICAERIAQRNPDQGNQSPGEQE